MKIPTVKRQWGLYNCGTLFCVCRTRKECKTEAEVITGHPWKECRKYMQIFRVTVTAHDNKEKP